MSRAFAEGSSAVEQDFTRLGQTLRSLYSTATELGQTVRERAGTLQQSLVESRIAGAEGLATRALAELQQGLGRTGGLFEMLQGIGSGLHSLHSQMQIVRRIGLFLKASVFSFAVESARTAECQQAFGSFVEELRGLATQIGNECDSLNSQVRATELLQARSREGMGSALKEMHQLATEVETTAAGACSKAQKMLDASLGALQQAEECINRIGQNAGEAVYHLQFGDIVRQKLEHVTGAIDRAAGLLDPGVSSAPGLPGTAEANYLIGVQIGQLQLIGEEVDSAQRKLSHAFQNIAADTSRLLDLLQVTRQGTDRADSLKELRVESMRLQSVQKQSRQLQNHAQNAAQQAADASRELRRHLAQLNEINREMHLQALNAIVKTTSLREEGATLEVLSTEVASLFRDSNRAVTSIVGTLEQILLTAEKAGAGEPGVVASGDAVGCDAELQEALERISGAYEQFQQASEQASALAEKQRLALEAGTDALGFLPGLSAAVAGHCRDLGHLRDLLDQRTGGKPVSAEVLQSLDQNYTMQSERDIHAHVRRSVETGDVAPRAPGLPAMAAVELFETPQPEFAQNPGAVNVAGNTAPVAASPTVPPGAAKPDLDDNIELF